MTAVIEEWEIIPVKPYFATIRLIRAAVLSLPLGPDPADQSCPTARAVGA